MSFRAPGTFSRYRLPNPDDPEAEFDDPDAPEAGFDDPEANPDAPEVDFNDPDDAEANPDDPEADFDDPEANPDDPEAGTGADHLLSKDGLLADGTLTRMTGSPCAGPDDSGEVFFDRSTFTMVGVGAGAAGFWDLFGRPERDPPEEEPLYFGPSQAELEAGPE